MNSASYGALAGAAAVLALLPAAARADDCSATGVPAGASIVVEGPAALAYEILTETSDGPPLARYVACAKPAGQHHEIASIDTAVEFVRDFAVGGPFVGYHRGASLVPTLYRLFDATSGTDGPFIDVQSPRIGPEGDVLGYPRYADRELRYHRPGAQHPVILDLAEGAEDVTLSDGRASFTQSGRSFTVNTRQPALAGPPRSRQACRLLSDRQAQRAGAGPGESVPGLTAEFPRNEHRSCSWDALDVLYREPLSRSGRRALVRSARAAGIDEVTTSLPEVTAFVRAADGSRTLSVVRGGVLIQLKSRAEPPVGTRSLVRAARHVLRRFGWRTSRSTPR